MEPIFCGNPAIELPLPPFEFTSIQMEEHRCNKREYSKPSCTTESKKIRCSPQSGTFIFPASPSCIPKNDAKNQGNGDLQYLEQEVKVLRSQVEELSNSESVMIGDLKSEIKKLSSSEPARVKELNQALTNMQKSHKLLLKTETRRANELTLAMKEIHQKFAVVLKNSDDDNSTTRSVYVSPNEKVNKFKGIERNPSHLMLEYNEAVARLQREVNDITMNLEASKQESDMIQDPNGQTDIMSHDLPPLQNILAQVTELTTEGNIHENKVTSFVTNIKTSISAVEDMVHSMSMDDSNLKNKISRLQTEAFTKKVEAENAIGALQKELKEVNESENIQIGELKAENSRLRRAMMGNFSFDSSELELMKSESDGSNESCRPLVLSDDRTDTFQTNKGQFVNTVSNDASIGSMAHKPFINQNVDASPLDERLMMPHFEPRPKPSLWNSCQLKAKDEAQIASLREQLEEKDNEIKALRDQFCSATEEEEEVDMIKEQATPLKKSKNDDTLMENKDSKESTPQRISELTEELNKWRIKATLLVEKKNRTRNLKKDNSKLKKRVEELRVHIQTQTKSEATPTVSPGGMPPSPTNRCPI